MIGQHEQFTFEAKWDASLFNDQVSTLVAGLFYHG